MLSHLTGANSRAKARAVPRSACVPLLPFCRLPGKKAAAGPPAEGSGLRLREQLTLLHLAAPRCTKGPARLGLLAEPLARGESGRDGGGRSGTPERELTPRNILPGLVAAIPEGLCSDV